MFSVGEMHIFADNNNTLRKETGGGIVYGTLMFGASYLQEAVDKQDAAKQTESRA